MNSSVILTIFFEEIKPLLRCKIIRNLKTSIMQQLLLTIAFVLLSVFIAHSKEGKINLIKTIVKVKNNKITEEKPLFFSF